ncbi:MAG: hypothetical protein AAGG51_00610 [Cyanobacteria bacterium P01_G01_bin.54]
MNTKISTSGLPNYIDRRGEQSLLQPYQTYNTKAYGFYLLAKPDKLQALCDRYLNEPAGGAANYAPLVPLILVLFNDYPHLGSIPHPEQGFISYKEVVFAVPVVDRNLFEVSDLPPLKTNLDAKTVVGKKIEELIIDIEKTIVDLEGFTGTLEELIDGIETFVGSIENLTLDGVTLFTPFIFASDSIAISSGREVYGFPKQWGWIEMPTGPDINQPLSLEAVAWQIFGINNPAIRQRITQVTNKTETNTRLKVEDLADLIANRDAIRGQLRQFALAGYADLQIAVSPEKLERIIDIILIILTRLFDVSFENVFLKQFRDAEEGEKACYQAVIKAPFENIRVNDFQLYCDQFIFEIPELESLELKEELGLIPVSDQHPNQFAPIVSYYSAFRFKVANGTILWQAGQPTPWLLQRYIERRVEQYVERPVKRLWRLLQWR